VYPLVFAGLWAAAPGVDVADFGVVFGIGRLFVKTLPYANAAIYSFSGFN